MKTRILYLLTGLLLFTISCTDDEIVKTPPTVKTLPTTKVGEKFIIIGGEITNDGGSPILKKGVFFSKQKTASLENGQVFFATGENPKFTQTVKDLEPETTYYIRAFATNAIGTNYGEEITFSTLKETFKPEMGAIAVNNIEATSAQATMKLKADGGSPIKSQGIVISTEEEPTKENGTVIAATELGSTNTQTHTISNLKATTTYYVRAFAENKNGIAYSEIIKFRTKIQLVLVEGGTFKMGSSERTWSQPIHDVNIKSFKIRPIEVTNAEFVEFLNAKKDDFNIYWISYTHESCQIKKNDDGSWALKDEALADYPAAGGIRIFGAQAYAEWVGGRLPTEAEFEYAAKGGNKSKGFKYAGSNDIEEVAWYIGNSQNTQPVATKKPNELGLYDMTGNVNEWCADTWHENYEGAPTDGSAWMAEGKWKYQYCVRGGSFQSDKELCLVDYRACVSRFYIGPNAGFRVVFDVK